MQKAKQAFVKTVERNQIRGEQQLVRVGRDN